MNFYKNKQIPSGVLTLDGTWIPTGLALFPSEIPKANNTQTVNTGGWVDVAELFAFGIQIAWTGTPVGNFVVEGSNDGNIASPLSLYWNGVLAANFAAGGAAGNVCAERYFPTGIRYVRLNYQFGSSTGVLTNYTFNGIAMRDN